MASNINVHFLSAECYPCAKTGGLADVVGALPKYLNLQGANVEVFIPRYKMPWFEDRRFESIFSFQFKMGNEELSFEVQKYEGDELGFSLYVIDIPGKFDRFGVYAGKDGVFFVDEVERYIAFQTAYLFYLKSLALKPDVVHPHDHHMGLIPFLMQYSYEFKEELKDIPTVFTIHNQRYQGCFSWDKQYLLPQFDTWKSGLLDWANEINPLSSAVRCSWKLTTVSPSYMEELKHNSFGLEWLFDSEAHKSMGILNGIDSEVWDPKKDELIKFKLKRSVRKYKLENKKELISNSPLSQDLPLMAFIGRFAGEKGADLIPGIIESSIQRGIAMNYIVLGTGDKSVESGVAEVQKKYKDRVIAHITYNEKLSHQIYAGADFLIMPSRVEPCGLNQLYSLRYATIPIVNNLGGLKDSIVHYDGQQGTGLKFNSLDLEKILDQIINAAEIYNSKEHLDAIRNNALDEDNSWLKSAHDYLEIYKKNIEK